MGLLAVLRTSSNVRGCTHTYFGNRTHVHARAHVNTRARTHAHDRACRSTPTSFTTRSSPRDTKNISLSVSPLRTTSVSGTTKWGSKDNTTACKNSSCSANTWNSEAWAQTVHDPGELLRCGMQVFDANLHPPRLKAAKQQNQNQKALQRHCHRRLSLRQTMYPAPPTVSGTTKSSKTMVRTGVFVGHAIRYLINSVPKPGT